MPIQRFKRVLRARLTRAAGEFKPGPFAPAGVNVARHVGDHWRATTPDPQFLFPAPHGVSKLVVYFNGERDGALTPRVYFDWGGGFSEADSARFNGARASLIRFDFSQCPDLRKLRIDPHEGSGDFVFRWGVDAEGEELARAVEPELAALEALRAPLLRADVRVADYAPEREGRPFGVKRTPRSAHEHFLHACALAGRELGGRFDVAPATPLISFVSPLYNTPVRYLDDLVASFRRQAPGIAELILSDDGSTSAETTRWLANCQGEPGIVVKLNGINRGIAGAINAGASVARGKWITFIDHDDALAEHAVAVVAAAIADNPGARFFYSDELIADGRMRTLDFFDKPAFDDVLLSGVNYINHLSIFARELFDAVGGLREGFDGSQDYDLLLRALARVKRDEVRHIPYPAYVWRRDGRSYSVKFIEKATANARRALAEAYARGAAPAEVEPAILPDLHRVRLARKTPPPKVSVVIANGDGFRRLSVLTEGLFAATDYPDLEVIAVDDGAGDADTLALYEKLQRRYAQFALDREPAPASVAAEINRGLRRAKGDAVLVLDGGVEVIEPGWLAEMVECLAFEDAGIVGARLLSPAGDLQHAGLAVGLGGLAGPWFAGRPADFPGPMGRLSVRSAMTAVSGACMLISRACLEAVGGFDEAHFPAAYGDVDFCLRARAAGFRTIYTPFATLVSHKPASRSAIRPGLLREQAALIERQGVDKFLDPVLSPWRDRENPEPGRIMLDAPPKAR